MSAQLEKPQDMSAEEEDANDFVDATPKKMKEKIVDTPKPASASKKRKVTPAAKEAEEEEEEEERLTPTNWRIKGGEVQHRRQATKIGQSDEKKPQTIL